MTTRIDPVDPFTFKHSVSCHLYAWQAAMAARAQKQPEAIAQRDPGDEQAERDVTATVKAATLSRASMPLLPTTERLLAVLLSTHSVSGPPDEVQQDEVKNLFEPDQVDTLIWCAGGLRLVVMVDGPLDEISVDVEHCHDVYVPRSRGARWSRLGDVPGTLDSIAATVRRILGATAAEVQTTAAGLQALCPRVVPRVG